jgi:DNA-binding winged helix-turn-helix (wHTH) protein
MGKVPAPITRVGDFTVDSSARELRRGDDVLPVTSRAFDLLLLLLERRPAVVTKADILDVLWPESFVDERNVPNLVTEIRKALKDNARRPRYIRTVHGHGYAFCAAAPPTASGYQLVGGDREIVLFAGDNVVGRGEKSTALLDSPSVSRRHALIRVDPDRITIQDLDSRNGTYVAGKRVAEATLRDGDVVRIGRVTLTLRAVDRLASTDAS